VVANTRGSDESPGQNIAHGAFRPRRLYLDSEEAKSLLGFCISVEVEAHFKKRSKVQRPSRTKPPDKCTTHGTSSGLFSPSPPFPPPPPNSPQRPRPQPRPLNGTNATLSVFPCRQPVFFLRSRRLASSTFGTYLLRGHTCMGCSGSSCFMYSRSFECPQSGPTTARHS